MRAQGSTSFRAQQGLMWRLRSSRAADARSVCAEEEVTAADETAG
jgi:hypothetical protein